MNMFQRHKSKNHAENKYYWIVLTTVVFNTFIWSDSLRYRSHKNHFFLLKPWNQEEGTEWTRYLALKKKILIGNESRTHYLALQIEMFKESPRHLIIDLECVTDYAAGLAAAARVSSGPPVVWTSVAHKGPRSFLALYLPLHSSPLLSSLPHCSHPLLPLFSPHHSHPLPCCPSPRSHPSPIAAEVEGQHSVEVVCLLRPKTSPPRLLVDAHRVAAHQVLYSETSAGPALVARRSGIQPACWSHWASLSGGAHCPGSNVHYPDCPDSAGVHACLAILAQTHTHRNLTLDVPIELGAPSAESDTEPAKRGWY